MNTCQKVLLSANSGFRDFYGDNVVDISVIALQAPSAES
jgi:hypothetical protein